MPRLRHASPNWFRALRQLPGIGLKVLRRFQRIAHWGACRKTPVAEQNHHLEAKKLQEVGGCKVRELSSTYVFRGASNRWSDSRYSCREAVD
jgi:hypothetical protein